MQLRVVIYVMMTCPTCNGDALFDDCPDCHGTGVVPVSD